MERFKETMVISPLSDGKTWKLLSELRYEVGRPDSGDVVEVPIGFYTDFASIPHIFWLILPRWGRYGYAAVIHDFLYWDQTRTRLEADQIFLEAMTEWEVPAAKKYPIYWAVRLFGCWAWSQNKKRNSRDTSLSTDTLKVTPLFDGKTWMLISEYRYDVGALDSGDVVEVPAGFYTNFISMPDAFWMLLPRWGKYAYAAVIHDFLYWEQTRTRLEADQIFLEAITLREASETKKYAIYWTIRLLGFFGWRRNAKLKANAN